jgi:hypothetical protein
MLYDEKYERNELNIEEGLIPIINALKEYLEKVG